MNRKIIPNWKTVTKQQLFLYTLQDRLPHFYEVSETDIIEFCRFCIDNNLLEFLRQKEYGGTIAEFHVLKDFNLQWKEFQFNRQGSYPIYTMEQGDMFILTEIIGTATRKRGLLNLYDEWCKEIDVSTDEKERMTFYENMKERLSYDRK